RSRTGSRKLDCGLRADQSPVPRRHCVVPAGAGLLSGRHGRRGRSHFPDRREVAAGADQIELKRGRMRATTGLVRGVGRRVALLALLAAVLAVPSRALAQQPAPAGAPAAQTERAGGEASLVLPDLAQVPVGGYNGRTLLMGGMVVAAVGIAF